MEFYAIKKISLSGQNSRREHEEMIELDDISKTSSTQGTTIPKLV